MQTFVLLNFLGYGFGVIALELLLVRLQELRPALQLELLLRALQEPPFAPEIPEAEGLLLLAPQPQELGYFLSK